MGDNYAKKAALENPETLATVVHAIVRQMYGPEVYEFDPLTVYLDLRADLNADMHPVITDRWSAMQVLMSNNAFFTRLDAFLGICNTLSSGAPFFTVFDPVTTEEAAWAIAEASLNRELLPFSYPIKQYLKKMLERDGYKNPDDYPDIFDEVFRDKPRKAELRKKIRTRNQDVLDGYVDEQLKDLVVQFDRIPTLKAIDDIILRRSLDEYVGPSTGEEEEEEE